MNVQTASSVILYLNPHPHIGFNFELLSSEFFFTDVMYGDEEDVLAVSTVLDEEMSLSMRVNGLDELRARLGELLVQGGKWAKVKAGIMNDARTKIVRKLKEESLEVEFEDSPSESG